MWWTAFKLALSLAASVFLVYRATVHIDNQDYVWATVGLVVATFYMFVAHRQFRKIDERFSR